MYISVCIIHGLGFTIFFYQVGFTNLGCAINFHVFVVTEVINIFKILANIYFFL